MGATGWQYFVPYQADIEAALQRLRDEVFASEEYTPAITVTKAQLDTAFKGVASDWETNLAFFESQAGNAKLPQSTRDKFSMLASQLKQLRSGKSAQGTIPMPRTIDELLQSRGESGTHSILDVILVSPTPEFGAVSPLPKSEVGRVFGSEMPTRLQIEKQAKAGALESYTSKRWQGIYVVAYQDANAVEIFFAGCSGD